MYIKVSCKGLIIVSCSAAAAGSVGARCGRRLCSNNTTLGSYCTTILLLS
jgi:hypothetical protein